MYNLWLSRGYLSQTQYFGLQHPAPAHSKVGTTHFLRPTMRKKCTRGNVQYYYALTDTSENLNLILALLREVRILACN